ncbi:hypothetical protein P5G50_01170 [Leifsonia sp. F6_8S_P_1B]|uniref:ABC-2 family transporter protein n=1 Tax=Leifsonia williamsii TaxID=3035919 RepID=A0ABT8K7C3_9MICO|nr:hypothetical protein [Leifsonia williamsii]MDN4613047.1 hypothetical protein [Leifsonia williamsii]
MTRNRDHRPVETAPVPPAPFEPRPFGALAGGERTRTLTIAGLALAPLLVVGVLAWGLLSPGRHLDRVTAAIVNDDVPVTSSDGATVPLGRQFAGALIAGGQSATAAAGATTTTAGAPTTAPVSTSTSTTAASSPSPTPSHIPTPVPTEPAPTDDASNFAWVLTNDDEAAAGLASGRYAAVLTIPPSFSADATSLGGPADSAQQATVTVQTSPSAAIVDPALTAAVTEAATASLNRQLTVQYLKNVYAGFTSIDQQIGQAATGAESLSEGAASLAAGTQSLADGTASLAAGTQSLSAGADSLDSGLASLAAGTQALPEQTAQLAAGATAVSDAVGALAAATANATTGFGQVVAEVCATPAAGLCARATAALQQLQQANGGAATLARAAGAVAAGNDALAAAMPQVVDGIDASASGASEVAAGAAQSADGAEQVSGGAASAASGAQQTAAGAAQLASGLEQATASIPSYTDSQASALAAVAAEPVIVDQTPPSPGLPALPLYCVLALWVGAMLTTLARRAIPTHQLLSSVASGSIALRSAALVAAIGAGQGLLVAGAAQFGLALDPGAWTLFALACAGAGAAFCLVNQGLAAAFGGVGRLAALGIAVVALVAGFASTAPPALVSLAGALPTAPGLQLLRGAASGDGGSVWAGAGLLLLFALGGVALTFAGVAARRSVRLPRTGREVTPTSA